MNDLVIRPLRDENEARACTARLVEFGPWQVIGIPAEKIFRDLTNPEREVFVAALGPNPAGVLILHLGGSFDGYIQLLAVFPEFQGRGLGESVMRFAEGKIFQRSKNVFLSVSSFNHRAQKFYERLGYRKTGELENFLVAGMTEILMRKTRGPLLEFSAPK
ncbi:MAG TPA: N-acetyltransferase [Candidatus Sulfotelmatobacter sp.]|nr:N-acetyltransferase [Candidatus Sulfotelmatobacter sp.]